MYSLVSLLIAVYLCSIEVRVSSAVDDESCGKTSFTNTSGIISYSPPVRIGYRMNATCTYRITVGENNIVSLRFLNISLERLRDYCHQSWITISCSLDGTPRTITSKSAGICHQSRWTSELRLTDCPVLLVHYVARNLYSLDGQLGKFRLQYEIVSTPMTNSSDVDLPEIGCGQTVFSNRSGSITLPSNDNITLGRVNCTYTIETSRLNRWVPSLRRSVLLDVSYFDLLTLTDSLDSCVQRHLQIICTDNDGDQLSVWDCEQPFVDNHYGCQKLEIILRSDNYDPRPIRQIPYYRTPGDTEVEVEEDEEDDEYGVSYDYDGRPIDCGNTTFTSPSGIVVSPRFPLSHPHNLNCMYRITVGQNNSVFLKFLTFDLESTNRLRGCEYDWLKMSCSLSENSYSAMLTARKMCGQIKWTSALRFSNCSTMLLHFVADSSIARGGFRIQYSVQPIGTTPFEDSEVACGKTDFREPNGSIVLPNNPTKYLMRINCSYNVYANSSSVISLDMSSIKESKIYSSFMSCDRERFQVACVDGLNVWNTSICQSWNSQPVFAKCRQVQFRLSSEYFDFQENYQIPFKVVELDKICGNTSFNTTEGFISSPNFPLIYPSESNCAYSIVGGMNKVISIHFLTFDLEVRSYDGSCRDWIQMTCLQSNGLNPYADKRFCGSLTWPSVIRFFNCSTLLLNFSSDLSISKSGFSLNYTITESVTEDVGDIVPVIGCGHARLSDEYGRIDVPGEASMTPSIPLVTLNCTCAMNASTRSKGRTTLDFQQMKTIFKDSTDCAQGYLTIACMSGIIPSNVTRYCLKDLQNSSSINYTYDKCDSIQLSLRSNVYFIPQPSRIIPYTVVSNDCGETEFSDSSGYIKSPQYPRVYPHNIHCTYSIDVGGNKSISLQSLHFELEGTGDRMCVHDWLIIHCIGGTERSSDGTRERSLDWDFDDDDDYFYLSRFRSDRLASSYLDQRFCGSQTIQTTLDNCETVKLEFVTDRSVNRMGFNIQYTVQTTAERPGDKCGNTTFSNSSGNVKSPSYPQPYPSNIHCIYSIDVGGNRTISLQSLSFDIEGIGTYSCPHDWLIIRCIGGTERSSYRPLELSPIWNIGDYTYHSRYRLHRPTLFSYLDQRRCGSETIRMTLDNCETVKLEFYTDSSINKNGFNIQYTIEANAERPDNVCGNQTFSDSDGVIVSPSFDNEINCTYIIEAGWNKSVTLEFLSFETGYYGHPYLFMPRYNHEYCLYTWLMISCLSGSSSASNPHEGKKICRTPFRNPKISGCDYVSIEFYSSRRAEFRIKYTVIESVSPIEDGCGNRIFSNVTGNISSPGFPSSYPYDMNCTYDVEVGVNKSLILDFRKFDLEMEYSDWNKCPHDWVQVRCTSGESAIATNEFLNTKICGFRLPFKRTVTGCRKVSLNFVSDSSTSREGFHINYRILNAGESECGNQIFSNSTGIISSPDYPSPYPHNLSCTYYIEIGSPSNSISLQFLSLDVERLSSDNERQASPLNQSTYCPNDWVQMRCLSNETIAMNDFLNRKICGFIQPFNRTLIGCRRLALEFVTDFSIAKRGFMIQYTIINQVSSVIPFSSTVKSCPPGCNLGPGSRDCVCTTPSTTTTSTTPLPIDDCENLTNTFTNQSGHITSPLRGGLRRRVPCTYSYNVIAQQISTVYLTITVLRLTADCDNDWISIGCLKDNSGELHFFSSKVCRKIQQNQTIIPSCSNVQLLFHTVDANDHFNMDYRVKGVEEVCGRTSFTEPYGNLTLPKPSTNYLAKFNCSYSIFVDNYSAVTLSILSFANSTGDKKTCPDDWILIFCRAEGLERNQKITHSNCSRSEIQTSLVLSNCSVMDIVFHNSNVETGRFFKISYTLDFHYATVETSSSQPDTSTATKILCPKGCQISSSKTVCDCPTTSMDHISTEIPVGFNHSTTQSFGGSKPYGFLIAFIVILALVALTVLTVICVRRRLAKPKEDEIVLVEDETEHENQEPRIIKKRIGSFFSFRFRKDQSRYVRMDSIPSTTDNNETASQGEKKATDLSNEYQPDSDLTTRILST